MGVNNIKIVARIKVENGSLFKNFNMNLLVLYFFVDFKNIRKIDYTQDVDCFFKCET